MPEDNRHPGRCFGSDQPDPKRLHLCHDVIGQVSKWCHVRSCCNARHATAHVIGHVDRTLGYVYHRGLAYSLTASHMQVREFQPKMVAIRDASKLEELKEAIKDVPTQPEILVGDEGAIEVARHSEVDAVVTGIVGARSGSSMLIPCPILNCNPAMRGLSQMGEPSKLTLLSQQMGALQEQEAVG